MTSKGFTLLELVIVLVLIGISAVFGSRFIADMAGSYVATAERSQALAGARFLLERLKRELSLAYSPSIYLNEDNRCVSFVPVLAAGKYSGQVKDANARFIMPLVLQGKAISEVNLVVRADSGEASWQDYPASPPANVFPLLDLEPVPVMVDFAEAFSTTAAFIREGLGGRYTLLRRYQVRYCIADGQVLRSVQDGSGWSGSEPMLTQVTSNTVFSDYDESLQLLAIELSLQTRDGVLALPSQIQVIYEP